MGNIIGEDIRLRREELGISLRKFASEVGISPTYLSQVETGAQYPSIDILKSIYSLFPEQNTELASCIIRNNPELLLILQLFANINEVMGFQYAKYVFITYIMSLYIANLKVLASLKIQENHFGHETERILALKNIFHQLDTEITFTQDLRPLDTCCCNNNYRNEIENLVNSGQLTIAEIATKSQVTENYIKQVLDGNRNPSVKIKQRLIKSLGLDVAMPVTYGIPKEYAESQIIQRVFNRTNDIRQLPNISFFNEIIKFAVEFTIRNITIDVVRKWSFPDLECAKLITLCFTEALGS